MKSLLISNRYYNQQWHSTQQEFQDLLEIEPKEPIKPEKVNILSLTIKNHIIISVRYLKG